VARRLGSPRLARATHRVQAWFPRFEGTRWQYLTGCFVALRAVKPTGASTTFEDPSGVGVSGRLGPRSAL
jgi:hypothetical protein